MVRPAPPPLEDPVPRSPHAPARRARRRWAAPAAATLAVVLAAVLGAPAAGAAVDPWVVGGPLPVEVAVDQAYRDMLGRDADAGGVAYWAGRRRAGDSPGTVVSAIGDSPEYRGVAEPTTRLYWSALGRAPDTDGLRYWIRERQRGLTLPGLADAFAASPELAASLAGRGPEEVVDVLYRRALGRPPEAGGLAYWAGQLRAGLGAGRLLLELGESAEARQRRGPEVEVVTAYLAGLGRAPEPGGLAYWSDLVRRGVLDRRLLLEDLLAAPEYRARFGTVPGLVVEPVLSGLTIPWDVADLPDGTLLVTERGGTIRARAANGSTRVLTADLGDLRVSGETGLMAIAADPAFAADRRIYTCQGHRSGSGNEVQVIGWTLSPDGSRLTRVADPLVGGITAGSGRHGGCQLTFGPDGMLWVGTGDAAIGTTPQDLGSLAGKVLRVDPATGGPAPGNPFAGAANANQRLVYSYGHRNVQGLAARPATGRMWSAEHGPDRDDELNLLEPGGNAGWNPVPGYDEAVPMTDLGRFPGAVRARWSSGAPPIALSGIDWLEGPGWGAWEGALAGAALRDQRLRLFFFSPSGVSLGEVVVPELDRRYGRLRAAHLGADGALYVTTSNGGGADQVLRIRPS